MPPRVRFFFSAMMLMLFLVAALPIYRELSIRADIWWTPRTMLVPLAESADRVEIYASGRPLRALLEAGQVRIAGDAGTTVLTTSEVGLRFNNWDRVRAQRLPLLLTRAAACGAALLLLLLFVTGRIAYRGERGTT